MRQNFSKSDLKEIFEDLGGSSGTDLGSKTESMSSEKPGVLTYLRGDSSTIKTSIARLLIGWLGLSITL